MDAIKKFFEKKKKDVKFKTAGQGHSLASEPVTNRVLQPHTSTHNVANRQSPTGDAKRAAAAALARAEQHDKKANVNWSLQAIKAQARREMEAEQKELEALNLNQDYKLPSPPKEVHLNSSPMLAVQGVYFYCSLIGPEVGTYEEIRNKIHEFLFNQLEEDKVISSCLIIHTCNRNKDKVKICVETLCKYIENILSNPEEEKFCKIRTSNKAYRERVEPLEGAKEFLEAAGFNLQELPFNEGTEKFWVFNKIKTGHDKLEQLRDTLVCAEPLKPQLDRSIRVLLPAEAAKHINLPDQFFNLTPDDLKKEVQLRADAVERSMVLRTKAMREREEIKEMKKYRFSLIRVRFPDGLILQGTFGVYEKFDQTLNFIRENLVNDWRPFFLNISGGGKVTEAESSLLELKLVPATVLNFTWDASIQDPALDDNVYLKPETMMLLQNMDK